MKNSKKIFLSFVIIFSLFFVFTPLVFPENPQFQKFLKADVLIIANPGGLAFTPLDDSLDFLPIVRGIQATLSERGYKAVVVPYYRARKNFLGKLSEIKEIAFFEYRHQVNDVVLKIENFLKSDPSKKVVVTGLSNGAYFTEKIIESLPKSLKDRVLAIEIGPPFWLKKNFSENVLILDNQGKDAFSTGKIDELITCLLRAPFLYLTLKSAGQELTFSQAIKASGHEYFWSSPLVNKQIKEFLRTRIK